MGLDMWLYEKEQDQITATEIGYWRKANQIRAFFASYSPELVDENIEMLLVTEEMLLELKENILCCLAEKNEEVSEKLLPTQSGFFFGSTEYDEWYYQNLQLSLPIIDRALFALKNNKIVFYNEWW